MNETMRQILENKRARRKELAALPVGEKLRILEGMIADIRAITASRPKKPVRTAIETSSLWPIDKTVAPKNMAK